MPITEELLNELDGHVHHANAAFREVDAHLSAARRTLARMNAAHVEPLELPPAPSEILEVDPDSLTPEEWHELEEQTRPSNPAPFVPRDVAALGNALAAAAVQSSTAVVNPEELAPTDLDSGAPARSL